MKKALLLLSIITLFTAIINSNSYTAINGYPYNELSAIQSPYRGGTYTITNGNNSQLLTIN